MLGNRACRGAAAPHPAGVPRIELAVTPATARGGDAIDVNARLVNDSDQDLVIELAEPRGGFDAALEVLILDLSGERVDEIQPGQQPCGASGVVEGAGDDGAPEIVRIVLAPHGHATLQGHAIAVGYTARSKKNPCVAIGPLAAGRYLVEAVTPVLDHGRQRHASADLVIKR